MIGTKVTFKFLLIYSILASMAFPKQSIDYSVKFLDLVVLLYFIGLLCSKALLGISMGLLLVATVWQVVTKKRPVTRPSHVYLLFTLIFLATLVSGINSDNKEVWMQFLSKKSPFLFLPFCFYFLREHFKHRYYDYLNWFTVLVVLFSFGILANYLLNAEAFNIAIGRGKSLKTTIDHTEFSIYVAFAIIVSLFMFFEKRTTQGLGNLNTRLLMAVFLIVFIHVLAVRSGLVVLYTSSLIVGAWYLFKSDKTVYVIPLILSIIIVPLIASKTLPSLKKKIAYTKWDYQQFKQGKGLTYSDSERLYSLQAGLAIAKTNPIVGVGIGDLKDDCDAFYQSKLGHTLVHYPHNQYLFAWAAMGIVGLIIYLIVILGPVFLLRRMLDPYLLMLTLVVISSAMVENTLERTFSIGFYLFFALLSICHLTSEWERRRSLSA